MTWRISTLNDVDTELEALPEDMRARFARICRLIDEFGPARVGAPHVKHLDGPIWEMRMRGRDGISRALYIVSEEQRCVVVVRIFIKKTRKTPQREIRLARKRAREFNESK